MRPVRSGWWAMALGLAAGLCAAACRPAAEPATSDVAAAQKSAHTGALELRFRGAAPRRVGAAFLARHGEQVYAVTARHRLGPAGGLPEEVRLERFEMDLGEVAFVQGETRLSVGPPDRAAQDHWSCDLLLLPVQSEEPVHADLPTLSSRALALGEGLFVDLDGERIPAAVTEVFDDGFLELDAAGAAPRAGTAVTAGDGAAVAVVSEVRDTPSGPRVAAQQFGAFLAAPARLLGQSAGTLGPPLEQAHLSPDGRLLAAGTPGGGRLVVVDLEARAPFAPLRHLDQGRQFGLGAFAADGETFVAAGVQGLDLFELRAGLPVARAEGLTGMPRALATDGPLAAVSSDAELLLVDLIEFQPLHRWPGSFGPLALSGSRLFAGTGDGRVLEFTAAGEPVPWVEPRGALQLGDLPTALAVREPWLAWGTPNAVRLRELLPGGSLRTLLDSGSGPVNDLAFAADGQTLWIATGRLQSDAAGDLVALDCYVRVVETATWREVARSHDHESPVQALFEREAGTWLGLCSDGTGFRWQTPAHD
jgi:hypothetical protein